MVRDRQGRTVRITDSSMHHIVQGHPELDGHELAISTAIETATVRCRGRRNGREVHGREVHFAQGLGRAAWLAVVIQYDGMQGEVITATGSDGPRDDLRI